MKIPDQFRDRSPKWADVKQFTFVNKGKKYPYGSKRQGFHTQENDK